MCRLTASSKVFVHPPKFDKIHLLEINLYIQKAKYISILLNLSFIDFLAYLSSISYLFNETISFNIYGFPRFLYLSMVYKNYPVQNFTQTGFNWFKNRKTHKNNQLNWIQNAQNYSSVCAKKNQQQKVLTIIGRHLA